MTADIIDARHIWQAIRERTEAKLDTMLLLGIPPEDKDGHIILTATGCETANWQRMNGDPRDGSDGEE